MRRLFTSKDSLRFATDSALLVGSYTLTGFCYLLVHPILGHTMDKVHYAGFVQLMSLMAVLGVPSNAARIAVSRYVAEFAHGNAEALWVAVYRRAWNRITWWGLIALAAWSAASMFWLSDVLNAPSHLSLVILGVITFFSLYTPIIQGTLQGAMQFKWFAASFLGAAILRVAFVSVAAFFLCGVHGVLVAVLLSILGGLLIGWWPLRHRTTGAEPIAVLDTAPIYKYLWPVMIGQGVVFLLVNADIVLSARLLPPEQLAAYGKVATLSRTVLFLSQPIALAMFPRAVVSPRLRILVGPLTFAFLVSACGALALTIVPSLPMKLMYGVNDPYYFALTQRYVWAALPHAMVMFIAPYLWARHRSGGVLLLAPVLLGYLLALTRCHGSPQQMILALGVAGWISLILLAGVVFVRRPVLTNAATQT